MTRAAGARTLGASPGCGRELAGNDRARVIPSRYCVSWLKPRELRRTVDDRPAALDARSTVALRAPADGRGGRPASPVRGGVGAHVRAQAEALTREPAAPDFASGRGISAGSATQRSAPASRPAAEPRHARNPRIPGPGASRERCTSREESETDAAGGALLTSTVIRLCRVAQRRRKSAIPPRETDSAGA